MVPMLTRKVRSTEYENLVNLWEFSLETPADPSESSDDPILPEMNDAHGPD